MLSPALLREGWILLWDGESFFGWERHGTHPKWEIEDGALKSESGDDSWMITTSEFSNFALRLEYRSPADGNSGVFLRASGKGEPALSGYEVQICDMHRNYPTGSLLNIKKARKVLPDPDSWHTMEITAELDHFLVRLDGIKILDAKDDKYLTGHIGFQFNRDHRIELRNIKLKPLGTKPLFNGVDLTGWTPVSRTNEASSAGWSVRGGMIHVAKGPGFLETSELFRDFILQMEIKTNPSPTAQNPSSGVFFRGEKGHPWSGYEAQISNQVRDGNPSDPTNFGTGGINEHQPARRVVPPDGAFFSKTIHSQGRHFAVWVNGIQVSDYTDLAPEGTDVSKNQARLTSGPIGLEAFDSNSNLDFRNIRIALLPER